MAKEGPIAKLPVEGDGAEIPAGGEDRLHGRHIVVVDEPLQRADRALDEGLPPVRETQKVMDKIRSSSADPIQDSGFIHRHPSTTRKEELPS
jgi:hypothetical protein